MYLYKLITYFYEKKYRNNIVLLHSKNECMLTKFLRLLLFYSQKRRFAVLPQDGVSELKQFKFGVRLETGFQRKACSSTETEKQQNFIFTLTCMIWNCIKICGI